ncbi:MAG: metallophosphoesterase [Oscillospiraceae bacterium]|jgi:calcineurin-like phosphoesterase family protein|nr:metallophosphoesterase [Oscillospiraceae bacterium]
MPQIFFIADTHFGHEAIIAYEGRPFAGAAAMDAHLIENWNRAVAPDDLVFMLGDFALAPAPRVRELTGLLAGRKHLVMGNHDRRHSPDWWREAGFDWVSPYPILVEDTLWLSHEPLYVNANMPYANIFGHVHGNPAYRDASAHSLCVSCERVAYTPITLDEARARMREADSRSPQSSPAVG